MDLIAPSPHARVRVANGDTIPVRRIFCIGRNYADHVREMGGQPDKAPPLFFTKPADAVVEDGATLDFPLATRNLHHEVELVVALGTGGVAIDADKALDHVLAYGVGCDLTRRDLQAEAKAGGNPWDSAKAFDQSAPVSAFRLASDIGHPASGRIWLSVNGTLKQQADLGEMIWPVPNIISHLSRLWTLAPGDLVFTGTPAGVGALVPGDQVDLGCDGVGGMSFRISAQG
jgi:fumarylpyruvate hydrolase